MGKGLGGILERGDQEGVVIELAEGGAAVAERWNRRSRRWGTRMGVAVSGWDTPHPPLPSTNNRIG